MPAQNQYVLLEIKPSNILRHGGPRDHRNVGLYVNGKLFEDFREDSQDFNYASGQYFDKAITEFVEHLRKFFPGDLKIEKRLTQEEFEDERPV